MKGLRIGRRRGRADGLARSPLELALTPALTEDRWHVPDRFNFTRDVVEVLASDPKRRALTYLGKDGIIEPRTFLQIAEGAARWAAVAREHGVRPQDRVLVLAETSVDWLEIVLGIIKVGGVTVPTPPTLSAAALEVRVSSTEATLVVADPSCQAEIEQMSFTPEVHYLDGGERRRAEDVPDEPTHDTSSRDLAFILSTPGTAGTSKGVAHTHGSLFATRVAAEHWLDAGHRDAVWCTAPPDSPHAVWSTLVGPWSRGAEVVLHEGEFDPLERLDLLYRLGPTIVCQSPAEYRALAELRELDRFRSPRLRRLVSTGDHLEPEIVAAFEARWGMTIHDGYGQAETNIVIADGAGAERKLGSIGRALPGQRVAIVDSSGDELPVGIEGDLAVRGRPPTMFAGYWESPDETRNAFRGDWYLTGDVAMRDEDDFFWFVGRAEDVITSRGRTFGPFEVEHVLRGHEAIAASAVVGIRDLQRGGQFVRAYVVPKRGIEGSEHLEAELRQFVGETLHELQVPREIVFVEELPRVGGKVSRHWLREQPVAGRPLWEVSASETEAIVIEAEPVVVEHEPVVAEPEAIAVEPEAIVIEPAPLVVEQGEPTVAPEPVVLEPGEPVVEPEPEPAPLIELEPVVEPEPEPVAEAAPLIELEPVVEPEPEPVAEAAPLIELEPVVEPEPVVDPEPVVEPEPDTVVDLTPTEPITAPEVEPVPVAEASPAREPEHKPEFQVVSEPGPLPDYIVTPSATPAPPVPPPATEPEDEPDLGPLPDYVVDPERPREPQYRAPEPPQPVSTALTGFVPEPEPEESSATSAGLYFPPVSSFPVPRTEPDSDEDGRRDAPKLPRRPRPPDPGNSKRSKSTGEPGDDGEEISWMQGLSNRLSAYSLAEDDEASPHAPTADSTEDAETSA